MAPNQETSNICSCCVCIFTTIGSIFITLWIASLRSDPPKCYIKSLYLPSLNKSLHLPSLNKSLHHNHSNTNTTIFFTLKLANPNKDKGVQYDAFRVSFALFVSANATLPVANTSLDGFYQGHGKTAVKSGSAEGAGGGVNRTVAYDRGIMKVFLRIEMATEVKYESPVMGYSKRHRLWGGANVEVNASTGEKVNPKDFKLGNVAAMLGSGADRAQGAGILVFELFALCVYLS